MRLADLQWVETPNYAGAWNMTAIVHTPDGNTLLVYTCTNSDFPECFGLYCWTLMQGRMDDVNDWRGRRAITGSSYQDWPDAVTMQCLLFHHLKKTEISNGHE